jgi:ubiquinone/menaquinone biosynthesis C-methylase UbiE
MDALRLLEFPDNYFDLVNQRLGISYLRTWDWPKLLEEFQRVCKPGGMIRITEAEPFAPSNSAALTRLCSLLLQALHQAGHLFTPEIDGLTSQLAGIMGRYGLNNVQKQAHPLEYRAGTTAGQRFYEDEKAFFRTIIPFLRKWTRVPDDYEEIYQQMLSEMQQPDFMATWNLLTVWGTTPG